jgi:uncharacterized protein (DUF2235 family)
MSTDTPPAPQAPADPTAAPPGERRNKRIAIFCDGTWNMLGAKEPTNVVRGAQMVLPYADHDGRQQLVYYMQGVGTSHIVNQKIESWLAGAFGLGLFQNVVAAYRFLMFNHRPGDEIYIFGFSRGAFTARSLAGMIRKCGILNPDQTGKLDEALKLYRVPGDEGHPNADLAQRFRAENTPEMIMKEEDRTWRRNHGYDPRPGLPFFRIAYLGVWDTVGAMGIPRHLWIEWLLRTADRHKFHNLRLSSTILSARHAVAVDEDRLSYAPTLWDKEDDAANANASNHIELWFPGEHSSVGGGGDIRGLSNATLLWVMEGARLAGLDLDATRMENFGRDADFTAPLRAFSKKPGLFSRIYFRGPRTGPDDEQFLAPATMDRLRYEAKSRQWKPYRPAALRPLLRRLFPDENL